MKVKNGKQAPNVFIESKCDLTFPDRNRCLTELALRFVYGNWDALSCVFQNAMTVPLHCFSITT